MSKYRLIYCFSKLLSDDDHNFSIILYALKKSVEYNSRFHDIKIYTDKITVQYLEDLKAEIELYDFTKFRFLDDIKIQTLRLLKENDILIDPDVFLYNELLIDESCDILLERPERITDFWYKEDYTEASSFEFSKMLTLSSKSGEVGNIGIIKFFNPQALENYINFYNKIKNSAELQKEQLPPFPKFSVLLGQLGLQNIIDKYGYKVKYAKDIKNNNYMHLSGYRKYSKGFLERRIGAKSVL